VAARRDAFRLYRDGAKKSAPALVSQGNDKMKDAERIAHELSSKK
jgi:hypothetical protein